MEVEDNAVYKTKEYWDERFQHEDEYDWLVTFADVAPNLKQLLPDDFGCRILVVGCGNSSFSFDLSTMGYVNITSIDFSPGECVACICIHDYNRPINILLSSFYTHAVKW